MLNRLACHWLVWVNRRLTGCHLLLRVVISLLYYYYFFVYQYAYVTCVYCWPVCFESNFWEFSSDTLIHVNDNSLVIITLPRRRSFSHQDEAFWFYFIFFCIFMKTTTSDFQTMNYERTLKQEKNQGFTGVLGREGSSFFGNIIYIFLARFTS